jgi:hypothetical protein
MIASKITSACGLAVGLEVDAEGADEFVYESADLAVRRLLRVDHDPLGV